MAPRLAAAPGACYWLRIVVTIMLPGALRCGARSHVANICVYIFRYTDGNRWSTNNVVYS